MISSSFKWRPRPLLHLVGGQWWWHCNKDWWWYGHPWHPDTITPESLTPVTPGGSLFRRPLKRKVTPAQQLNEKLFEMMARHERQEERDREMLQSIVSSVNRLVDCIERQQTTSAFSQPSFPYPHPQPGPSTYQSFLYMQHQQQNQQQPQQPQQQSFTNSILNDIHTYTELWTELNLFMYLVSYLFIYSHMQMYIYSPFIGAFLYLYLFCNCLLLCGLAT